MKIKIIGSNCSNGMKLRNQLQKVQKQLDEKIIIELIDNEKNKYQVTNKPGLVINDTLVSQGKVLTDREILKFIKSTT